MKKKSASANDVGGRTAGAMEEEVTSEMMLERAIAEDPLKDRSKMEMTWYELR